MSRVVTGVLVSMAGYAGAVYLFPASAILNAVLVSVTAMLVLSLLKVNVVASLLIAAFFAGVIGGLSAEETMVAFNEGISAGGRTALSYALLGAFAAAIAKSGLPNMLADKVVIALGSDPGEKQVKRLKIMLISVLLLAAVLSQNLIPVHIAFIPILIPPLLFVMSKLGIDRRLVACVLTFGLVTPYMFFPIGFGSLFLNDILLANIQKSGMAVQGINAPSAMLIPAIGMVLGLIVAMFRYRHRRSYDLAKLEQAESIDSQHRQREYSPKVLAIALLAIAAAFSVQLVSDSMIYGGLVGFMIFSLSGVLDWSETDDTLVQGMKMMAVIGFIMITAGGFAEVLRETGAITSLVDSSVAIMGNSKAVAAFLMLLVGLFITIGIGSSFSTIPIIAAIYVPLALQLDFSPLAIVALVGTAAALGDAGSPASDSTLGPTAGLNIDGQHDHMRDSVVPTFIHYNIPLLGFGWLAAMLLG
ncbi:MAG: Na+/H+ antiporter NhaC family protein [Halioglobus sp.]